MKTKVKKRKEWAEKSSSVSVSVKNSFSILCGDKKNGCAKTKAVIYKMLEEKEIELKNKHNAS